MTEPDARVRQALIGAAWRVLERAGYEGFKVQLVMREADVSARTFYRHFSDKEELALALMRDEMFRAARLLDRAVAKAEGPAEQVRRWIATVLGAANDERRVKRARLFSSDQALFRRFPIELDEGSALLRAPLRAALASGAGVEFPQVTDPDGDAELIYTLVGGELTNVLADPVGRDLDAAIAQTSAFVLRALGVVVRAVAPEG